MAPLSNAEKQARWRKRHGYKVQKTLVAELEAEIDRLLDLVPPAEKLRGLRRKAARAHPDRQGGSEAKSKAANAQYTEYRKFLEWQAAQERRR